MSDQPHHFASGTCCLCGSAMIFDPQRVPTIAVDAKGWPATSRDEIVSTVPMCRDCTLGLNELRSIEGMVDRWDTDESIWAPVPGLPE